MRKLILPSHHNVGPLLLLLNITHKEKAQCTVLLFTGVLQTLHMGQPHVGPDAIKNEKKSPRPHPMQDTCKESVGARLVRSAPSNPKK